MEDLKGHRSRPQVVSTTQDVPGAKKDSLHGKEPEMNFPFMDGTICLLRKDQSQAVERVWVLC